MTITSAKYEKIMSGVMFFQIFVNGLLIFFLHSIRNEEYPDDVQKEERESFAEAVSTNTKNAMFNVQTIALEDFNRQLIAATTPTSSLPTI